MDTSAASCWSRRGIAFSRGVFDGVAVCIAGDDLLWMGVLHVRSARLPTLSLVERSYPHVTDDVSEVCIFPAATNDLAWPDTILGCHDNSTGRLLRWFLYCSLSCINTIVEFQRDLQLLWRYVYFLSSWILRLK